MEYDANNNAFVTCLQDVCRWFTDRQFIQCEYYICKRSELHSRTLERQTRHWGRRRGSKIFVDKGKANARDYEGLQFP